MSHQSKLSNFSLVANKGRFTLILNDRDVPENASPEEREEWEWGTITWRMPFVVSRYLQGLTPDQQRNLLMPHVVPLRQIQGLIIASVGTVRNGFAQMSLTIQEHLIKLLNDFHEWAGRVEHKEMAKSSQAEEEETTLTICFAEPEDAEQIYCFIAELAAYEHASHEVKVTPEIIRTQLASLWPPFECLIAKHDGMAVGCAIFVQNYSTWTGSPGMHLEDLYVDPLHRKSGVGRMLLQRLAAIALERGYGRMEWSVLDWNKPMHGFSQSLGAVKMEDWTTWRLDQPGIAALTPTERNRP